MGIDMYKEFRDKLKVQNYEYEGSADFLEEELLRKELQDIETNNNKNNNLPQGAQQSVEKSSYKTTIQEAIDEMLSR